VYPYAQMIKLQDDKIFVYTGDSWVYYSNYTTVDDLSTVKNTGIIYSKADDAFLTYVDGQYLRLHESRYDVTTSVEV
jgi:Xaa-Pro aminopeptidase